jgi:hypothetical protein
MEITTPHNFRLQEALFEQRYQTRHTFQASLVAVGD